MLADELKRYREVLLLTVRNTVVIQPEVSALSVLTVDNVQDLDKLLNSKTQLNCYSVYISS